MGDTDVSTQDNQTASGRGVAVGSRVGGGDVRGDGASDAGGSVGAGGAVGFGGLAGADDAGATAKSPHGAEVTILEPALWRQLGDTGGPASRAASWVALAARLIPGAHQAVVVLAGADGFAPAAFWPTGEPPRDLLMAAVEAALEQRAGAVRLGRVRGPTREAAVALPLLAGGELIGAAAVVLAGAEDAHLRLAMRQLQWGAGWLRAGGRMGDGQPGDGAAGSASRQVLELLGAVVEETGFRAAAQRAVTELATRFGCDRVSLGLSHGGTMRVEAISHSAMVEQRSNDTAKLADAMAEAVDQRAILRFPPTAEDAQAPLARHAQEQLAAFAGAAILTIPLVQQDCAIGALLLERPGARPLSGEEIARLDVLAAMAGPVLLEKWRDDRWLVAKAVESVTGQCRMLFGPTHAGRKLVILALLLLAVVASTWHGEYHVIAQARLEGSIRRGVVSGLDGFLREAPVRAGDQVRAGQVLAMLDDRDLTLERLRWSTERQQRVQELERAIGERRRADTNILQAELDQADAQLALADAQLARTRIVAPFDALVVAGDHSQSIGGAVRRGDLLFELAPLNNWRVVLDVEEAQVADAQPGQHGKLVVTAMPYQSLDFTVTRVTPVARIEDGRSVFRVEGALAESSPRLRPGMQGVGRIEIGERLMVWIWTRRIAEQVRLLFWQLVP